MSRGTTQEQGRPIYLRIAGGKIVETVTEDTPGAVQRTNKNGKVVYEQIDGYVDGIATSMYHRDHALPTGEIVQELIVRLRDKDEHYHLSIKRGSRYWSELLLRLPNIDLSKPFRIAPYDFMGKDEKTGGERRVIGLNIYQGGDKVDPKWTKTNPGDLPQGVQVQKPGGSPVLVNGRPLWDFSARDEYLLKIFSEIVSQMQWGDHAVGGTNDTAPTGTPPAPIDGAEDDLPF